MDNPETLASLGTQDTGRIQPPPQKKTPKNNQTLNTENEKP
jgi:hypothetical protein